LPCLARSERTRSRLRIPRIRVGTLADDPVHADVRKRMPGGAAPESPASTLPWRVRPEGDRKRGEESGGSKLTQA